MLTTDLYRSGGVHPHATPIDLKRIYGEVIGCNLRKYGTFVSG